MKLITPLFCNYNMLNISHHVKDLNKLCCVNTDCMKMTVTI